MLKVFLRRDERPYLPTVLLIPLSGLFLIVFMAQLCVVTTADLAKAISTK